jgi:hypothetical protein
MVSGTVVVMQAVVISVVSLFLAIRGMVVVVVMVGVVLLVVV